MFLGSRVRPVRRADKFIAIREPIVSTACYGDSFTFLCIYLHLLFSRNVLCLFDYIYFKAANNVMAMYSVMIYMYESCNARKALQ
jgi:hypothetical protein